RFMGWSSTSRIVAIARSFVGFKRIVGPRRLSRKAKRVATESGTAMRHLACGLNSAGRKNAATGQAAEVRQMPRPVAVTQSARRRLDVGFQFVRPCKHTCNQHAETEKVAIGEPRALGIQKNEALPDATELDSAPSVRLVGSPFPIMMRAPASFPRTPYHAPSYS